MGRYNQLVSLNLEKQGELLTGFPTWLDTYWQGVALMPSALSIVLVEITEQ